MRIDPISKREVIISEIRAKRPDEFNEKEHTKKDICVFCPGNEDKTPAELYRVGNKVWRIRVFPNKFPITECHEVIVLCRDHKDPLTFSSKKWEEVFQTYKERFSANKCNNKYILIFHNNGAKAGASISHPHSQLVGFDFIPDIIKKESESCKEKLCCEMIKKESRSKKKIYSNKEFIAFTNYASRFPYEVHIYPKKHIKSIDEVKDMGLLAEVMEKVMKAYKRLFKSLDFNFVLHNAPKEMDYHFHIEIYPRIKSDAGVEYGTDVGVNIVKPETAANYLKEAIQ